MNAFKFCKFSKNYFCLFKDETQDSETQDPTAVYQQPPCILKDLREFKELMMQVAKKQTEMDKELKQLVKQQGAKNFDLAKLSHAVIFTPKPVFIPVNTGQERILNIITVFYIYFGFTNTLSFNLQDNVNKILSKAYVQLGRFSKQNASKTVSIFREEKDSIKLKFHIIF